MNQNIAFTPANFVQDYQRGWDQAQQEYLRQQKQARLKPNARTLPKSTGRLKVNLVLGVR